MVDFSSYSVKRAVELTAFKNLCFSGVGTEMLKNMASGLDGFGNHACWEIGDRI